VKQIEPISGAKILGEPFVVPQQIHYSARKMGMSLEVVQYLARRLVPRLWTWILAFDDIAIENEKTVAKSFLCRDRGTQ